MILIRVNAEANFKICIIESKNPRKSSKISKKISFVSITITINACASSDSPRSWSPFQTFVQRALRSGIIFLTRRHRKLGRTRVVDTVHSSLSLSFPLLFRPCVCPPALESRIEIGIGVSRSLQITFDRPSHTRGPFTKPVQTYHESRRVNPWIPQFLEVNARSCLYFVLGSEAIRDRVGFERARDKIRWSSPSLSGK